MRNVFGRRPPTRSGAFAPGSTWTGQLRAAPREGPDTGPGTLPWGPGMPSILAHRLGKDTARMTRPSTCFVQEEWT